MTNQEFHFKKQSARQVKKISGAGRVPVAEHQYECMSL